MRQSYDYHWAVPCQQSNTTEMNTAHPEGTPPPTTYFVFLDNNKIPYAWDMNFHHSIPSHIQFKQILETDNCLYLHNSHIGDILVAKSVLIKHNNSYKTWTA